MSTTSRIPANILDFNQTKCNRTFHHEFLPVEFEGVNGLNNILFPDRDTSPDGKCINGFKIPLTQQQMEPRVILVKGEPGVGKTIFCAQLLNHFIQQLGSISTDDAHRRFTTAVNSLYRAIVGYKPHSQNADSLFQKVIDAQLGVDISPNFLSFIESNPCIRYILTSDSNGGLKEILTSVFGWGNGTPKQIDDVPMPTDSAKATNDNLEVWYPYEGSTTFVAVNNETDSWYPGVFSHEKMYEQIEMMIDKKIVSFTPKIVFLDSMNLVNSRMSHAALRTFITECKKQQALTFIISEHYKDQLDETSSQLLAQMEFLADATIELNLDIRQNYTTYSLRVPKMHYGRQTIGTHHYVIAGEKHSTSNIEPERKGIIIYPSLHYYLSHALKDTFSMQNNFVHTGISAFDDLLRKKEGDSSKHIIPDDSLFLLQGDASMYMTPIGLSLLCGGMFKYSQGTDNTHQIQADRDVLLISLSEEGNVDLFNTPLSMTGDKKLIDILEWRFQNATIHPSTFAAMDGIDDETGKTIWNKLKELNILDNFGNVQEDYETTLEKNRSFITELAVINKIQNILKTSREGEEHYRCSKVKPCSYCPEGQVTESLTPEDLHCHLRTIFEEDSGHSKNVGKKVIINKWCAYLDKVTSPTQSVKDNQGETDNKRTCRKLVVMSFRPGCLSPEQFLQLVENVLNKGKFSRVLFDSTAMIRSRFPLLATAELFLPALIRLFKSRNMISIFLDPTGQGSDDKLSFGLKNLADYTIDIGGIDREKPIASQDAQERRISIDNARNRNFKPVNLFISTIPYVPANTTDLSALKNDGYVGKHGEILGIPQLENGDNRKTYFIAKKNEVAVLTFSKTSRTPC